MAISTKAGANLALPFIRLWRQDGNLWCPTRVISYDHLSDWQRTTPSRHEQQSRRRVAARDWLRRGVIPVWTGHDPPFDALAAQLA